jgi:hypothetical protein
MKNFAEASSLRRQFLEWRISTEGMAHHAKGASIRARVNRPRPLCFWSNKFKGTGTIVLRLFSAVFQAFRSIFGRPIGRKQESRPSFLAVRSCQAGVP